MHAVFLILGVIAIVLSIVCSIIVLIEAFKDSILKGVLCFVCGCYFLYYALFDFEHENKWLIVIGSLGGGSIASGLLKMGGYY
ncbi:hypothetical protein [Fimbriimonas ginsengisoli]|uniref:Uncharacterized protein n=1 Tax=Fimbriimonas ginsengisoli Gsoil 348 TaxID=661478 RepID=A0A068NR45_FIMGI|nr:hypothetical protein [Fimbriimonas ginsengisoli]AIE85230.1 hypothetical protein OP10G_1862 [Fimbriimonas ginsengisoli Gsoil 348]